MAIKHHSRRLRPQQAPGEPTGVIDPTENVKALSEALSDRQDDLRELNNKYLNARLKALADRIKIEAKHQKEMRDSESKRLDAIRATDVAAVSTTAAQSLAAIQTLASTAQGTAETLRTQVTNTATTIANQTDRIVSPILERLAALEKTSNIGQGRSAMADPQVAELALEIRKLAAARETSTGRSEGVSLSWAVIIAVVGLLFLYLAYRQPAVSAPPVIYTPVVPGTIPPQVPR